MAAASRVARPPPRLASVRCSSAKSSRQKRTGDGTTGTARCLRCGRCQQWRILHIRIDDIPIAVVGTTRNIAQRTVRALLTKPKRWPVSMVETGEATLSTI